MYKVEVLWHRCRGCPDCEKAAALFKVVSTEHGMKATVKGSRKAVISSEELYQALKAQNRCEYGGIVIKPIRPWLLEEL